MNDILLDSDFDLRIENGDIVVGPSDDQHKKLLLLCSKGEFKEYPSTCVGIDNYLEAEDSGDLLREIKTQFTGDGMKINSVAVVNGKIKIDAAYE